MSFINSRIDDTALFVCSLLQTGLLQCRGSYTVVALGVVVLTVSWPLQCVAFTVWWFLRCRDSYSILVFTVPSLLQCRGSYNVVALTVCGFYSVVVLTVSWFLQYLGFYSAVKCEYWFKMFTELDVLKEVSFIPLFVCLFLSIYRSFV